MRSTILIEICKPTLAFSLAVFFLSISLTSSQLGIKKYGSQDSSGLPYYDFQQRTTLANTNRQSQQSRMRARSNCSTNKELVCNGTNKCLKLYQICDGFFDCPDRSDEKNCDWCNKTYTNELAPRFLIQNPKSVKWAGQSFVHCHYKIKNVKPETITNLRLRKFSVGTFNARTGICENAWIEIKDFDSDEMNDETDMKDSYHSRIVKRGILSKMIGRKMYDKVFFSERNLTSSTKSWLKAGRFCGNLNNFLSNYYSLKKYIIISYYRLINTNNQTQPSQSIALNETFEFEVSFYDKESMNPKYFSKQKYLTNSSEQLEQLNYDFGMTVETTKCNRLFTNCSGSNMNGCIINSPGFPGIYLKNLKCSYLIRNNIMSKTNYLNQKLVLINDNLQLDGTLCHTDQNKDSTLTLLSNTQLSSSYFCDNGLRQSFESCRDYLNIYDGAASSTSSIAANTQMSLVLMKRLCGMGRLPKVVTSKNALILELNSGPDGLFANTGFLFYVMNQRQYFENYHLFNQFDKTSSQEVKTTIEMNSIKVLERLQIDNCDTDMTQCIIQVGDDTITQIVSNRQDDSSKSKSNPILPSSESGQFGQPKPPVQQSRSYKFKIGYLFGLNQLHSNNFTLKYILKTKKFNTIAVYIDKFQPSSSVPTPTFSRSYKQNSDAARESKCSQHYLTIETSNLLLTSSGLNDYDDYYDDMAFMDPNKYIVLNVNNSSKIKNFAGKSSKITSFYSSKTNSIKNAGELGGSSETQRRLRARLCDPNDLNSSARFFLIESTASNTLESIQSKTNVVITYFKRNQSLSSSQLLDFKISFEFLDFDWRTFQINSTCDFIYNLNRDDSLPMSGYLTNPQASIFYKTSDETLQCRYRLIARANQYIKLTVKSIDFVHSENSLCENIYFTNTSEDAMRNQNEKCGRLEKKLVIKEIDYSYAGDSYDNDEVFSYDTYDAEKNTFGNSEYSYPSEDPQPGMPRRVLVNKLCLCKTNRLKQVYISKRDVVEVLFETRLDKFDDSFRMKSHFSIKYEFIDRGCDKLVTKNIKASNNKGKISNLGFKNKGIGMQSEMASYAESDYSKLRPDIFYEPEYMNQHGIYITEEEKVKREDELLKRIVRKNFNFHCKFHVKAPKNAYVYFEFNEIVIPKNCEENYIQLYSNFSRTNNTPHLVVSNSLMTRQHPFIKLCALNEKPSNNEWHKKQNSQHQGQHQHQNEQYSEQKMEGKTRSRKLLRRVAEVDEYGNLKSGSIGQEQPEQTGSFDPDIMESEKPKKSPQSMIIAEFFDEAVDNSSLSCYNSRNRVCFMTNDVVNAHNPFYAHYQASDSRKKMLASSEFYNDLVIEITTENVNELSFDLKYFYYFIDLHDQEGGQKSKPAGSEQSIDETESMRPKLKSIFDPSELLSLGERSKADCVFKCPSAVNDNNRTVKVCLDETLVCDGEINCIYNEYDEINCPIKLNAKVILIVLCTVFGFTLTVLFMFYIYRKYFIEVWTLENEEASKTIQKSALPRTSYYSGNRINQEESERIESYIIEA